MAGLLTERDLAGGHGALGPRAAVAPTLRQDEGRNIGFTWHMEMPLTRPSAHWCRSDAHLTRHLPPEPKGPGRRPPAGEAGPKCAPS